MPAPVRVPAKWLFRSAAVAAVSTLISSSLTFSQNQAKTPPKSSGSTAKSDDKVDEAAVDPFKIPDTNDPKELQEFLARLAEAQPEKRSLQGVRDHLRKIEGVVAKLQEKDIDESVAMTAADLRYQILMVLEGRGDENAAADRLKYVEMLSKSKQIKVAELGRVYLIAARVTNLGEMKADGRQKLIDDIAKFIGEGEPTQQRVELATTPPEILASLGDYEMAAKVLNAFAVAFESRKDERVGDLVTQLRGSSRRYGLVGNPMELKGKTVSGQDFNLESLKGKVVLVDFWATWCGPCMQEMPHIRELYEGYHGKGFDVVGVSLDHKREVLQAFLEAEKVPWVQLYADSEGDSGWGNPVAKFYGINSIPTAILINKEGKVISLNAIGRELNRLLEKELGPADLKPAAVEKEASKEK